MFCAIFARKTWLGALGSRYAIVVLSLLLTQNVIHRAHVLWCFLDQESRVSLADTDASFHIAACNAEFESAWQRMMAAISVETERIRLCIDTINSH